MGKNNRQRRIEKKHKKAKSSPKVQRVPNTNPVDIFRRHFEEAAGKAGLFELELRLLADRTPELKKLAFENSISGILPTLIDHFKQILSDEDIQILNTAIFLRNKILHAEMREIANKTEASDAGVQKFTGIPTDGAKIFDYIHGIVDGKFQGESIRQNSPQRVGIFGWLLENGSNGSFERAKSVLAQAIKIISRLCVVLDGIEPNSAGNSQASEHSDSGHTKNA